MVDTCQRVGVQGLLEATVYQPIVLHVLGEMALVAD